ncbi:nudC domain-containing protein 3 [Lampris incognitus]|uniref:nudC domain-containing protein 3 n=1 Tax=Lampris incognitus TaxID=2546036 RepID=UPI0024B59B00|nr:nudC domain-containing protein 3 [Lampris incognitus]
MASPLEMTEMYDNALLGVLQHVGNVQDFLHVYFGFLYRKTDFFRLLSGPSDRMGFPPGVAEKMVLKTFRTFDRKAEQDRERQLREPQPRGPARSGPPAVPEPEVASQPKDNASEEDAAAPRTEAAPSAATEPPSSASPSIATTPRQAHGSGSPTQGPRRDQAAGVSTDTGEPCQEQFQSNPDSYNGAVRENYSWSQDYSDIEVRVFVPKTVVKGRQVSVCLQSSNVCVCLREGGEEKVLMKGELAHKINTENSLWSLEPGHCVVLSLSKCGEVWWNAILKGEKEIDINQINRERSMATVDDAEHAVLDRLTFDYHQKLQGKPQSHEMMVHEMLKKGWDAEGSPFKGQQFDPSMFDIPPSAVQF